jgi:hypothetical protein
VDQPDQLAGAVSVERDRPDLAGISSAIVPIMGRSA